MNKKTPTTQTTTSPQPQATSKQQAQSSPTSEPTTPINDYFLKEAVEIWNLATNAAHKIYTEDLDSNQIDKETNKFRLRLIEISSPDYKLRNEISFARWRDANDKMWAKFDLSACKIGWDAALNFSSEKVTDSEPLFTRCEICKDGEFKGQECPVCKGEKFAPLGISTTQLDNLIKKSKSCH